MDIQTRIETAKANLRKAENAKTVAQTQHDSAEKQLAETVAEMAEAGVTPDTINGEITSLEEKVTGDLDRIERMIPVL